MAGKVREGKTATGGDADGVSAPVVKECAPAKRLLPKEKTTWNTRRELSYERRGDEANGANPQHVPHQDEEQPKTPHNHAGGAWRVSSSRLYNLREDRGNDNEREVKGELSRSTHSLIRPTPLPVIDGQRRGKARGAENACLACSRDSQSTTLPSRSRMDSSEITNMCELDMKSAVRGACCTKSKGEGRKPGQDARAAGRARQRMMGEDARGRGARPPHPPRKTTLSAPHMQGSTRSAEPRRETCKREPENSAYPQSKKKERKDRQRSPLTHETTAHFHRSVCTRLV
ncbi:hypothetical protein B0H11DRAFT_2424727 [Mycena galericulata]|nr:hypothetical protein B0H11DRAFT_2424727 [Mycena galericulata]